MKQHEGTCGVSSTLAAVRPSLPWSSTLDRSTNPIPPPQRQDLSFPMSSDLITLLIRTTCGGPGDVLVGSTLTTTTPRNVVDGGGGDDDEATASAAKLLDNGSSLSEFSLDSRGGGTTSSLCPGGHELGMDQHDAKSALQRHRRARTFSTPVATAQVSCDVAVLSTPSLGASYEASDKVDPQGIGAEGRQDGASATAQLDGVALGECGTTNVMTLTAPHWTQVPNEWNGGTLADSYSIQVRRCWISSIADASAPAAPMHIVPVVSVQTTWEAPSDLASSMLARVSVHLDASAIGTDHPFVPTDGGRSSEPRCASSREGLGESDADSTLKTTPATPSFSNTCSRDGRRRKVCLPRPWQKRGRRNPGPAGPTSRPRANSCRPEAPRDGPTHAGRAPVETVEAVNAWLERERLEMNRILAIHVLLWTVLAAYLVGDLWCRISRRNRKLQQQQLQQPRRSARGRAPWGAAHATFQDASHSALGASRNDAGLDDDTVATTPDSTRSGDNVADSTSPYGAFVPASVTTAARPARVSTSSFDVPSESGTLSPVSELKARHLLRIQAKRHQKAVQLSSSTTPPMTPVPHHDYAAVVTPVPTIESSTGAPTTHAEAVGTLESPRPAQFTPLPSWTSLCSESNESSLIPVSAARATSRTTDETACGADVDPTSRHGPPGDVEHEEGIRGMHPRGSEDSCGDVDGEGRLADTAEGAIDASGRAENNRAARVESVTPPPRAVRALRPIRRHEISPHHDSVLEAFWNLGE